MCCICLHFSDFNVLFFKKNKKLVAVYFLKKITYCAKREGKITCCAKREGKITCCEEKSQPLPPGY